MITIASIVEGKSEVESLPILIHRIREVVAPQCVLRTLQPMRVSRQSIIKPRALEHYVNNAAQESGQGGRILVLLDADDDCPKELARNLLDRARASRSDRIVRVVIAKSEFESWFLASFSSIVGKYSIGDDRGHPSNPESIRGAKRWLSQRMPREKTYQSTFHQPKLTREFDLELARINSPSFDKLWRDVEALILHP